MFKKERVLVKKIVKMLPPNLLLAGFCTIWGRRTLRKTKAKVKEEVVASI